MGPALDLVTAERAKSYTSLISCLWLELKSYVSGSIISCALWALGSCCAFNRTGELIGVSTRFGGFSRSKGVSFTWLSESKLEACSRIVLLEDDLFVLSC